MNIHPEFGESLSDYDRSLLWKRNILTAGALLACKVTHNRLYRNLIGKYENWFSSEIVIEIHRLF